MLYYKFHNMMLVLFQFQRNAFIPDSALHSELQGRPSP